MKKLDLADPLPWTGERLVTTCHRPMAYEHLHRYAIACGLAKGKRVLDIACGEGYGANLLAGFAAKVTGVDRDSATISHAKRSYRRRNLKFLEGTCSAIPCADRSIDLVASFETIEHIAEQAAFLAEIKRVLAPNGILVISSPDKIEYGKISETPNPFHENELDHDEFARLLRGTFKHVVVGKQRLVVGSWIAPDKNVSRAASATSRGWFDRVRIANGVYRGLYSLAVCSDITLPVITLGLFENYKESAETWDLLDKFDTPSALALRMSSLETQHEQKAQQIAAVQHDNEQKAQTLVQLQRVSEERQQQLSQVERDAEERAKHIAILQQENEEKAKQVLHFQRDAEERGKHIAILKGENEEKAKQVLHFQRDAEERVKHVTILQQENKEKAKQVLHFQREAEERVKHVTILQQENKEKAKQVLHFQREAEERAKHVAILKGENKEKAKQVLHFQRDAEERAKHVAILKGENEEKTKQVLQFQRDAEERAKHVAILKGKTKKNKQV